MKSMVTESPTKISGDCVQSKNVLLHSAHGMNLSYCVIIPLCRCQEMMFESSSGQKDSLILSTFEQQVGL